MLKASLLLFGALGISLVFLGLVYLSTDQFMPYHEAARQTDWANLGSNEQGLFLGLLKGLGAGALTAGSAIVFMALASLRKSARPFLALLPLVAIGYSSLLCYATYTVQTSTPGNPPLLLNILAIVAAMLASAMLLMTQRGKSQ